MLAVAALLVILSTASISPFPDCDSLLVRLEPPDTTAIVFLPDIVSGPVQEYGLTVSEDWSEIYFSRLDGGKSTIMMLTCTVDGPELPVAAPFSGRFNEGHPCLVPDGKRLVFVSRRPCSGARQALNPWMVERTESGWSAPKSLGKPVTDQTVHAPSFSAFGTIYASGIIRFRVSEEGYLPAEKLSPDIEGYGPAIAADESFLVFSARRSGGFGSSDLYVVFAAPDGGWSEPQNLGAGINTEHVEGSPTLSLDGRFLFFSRHQDIWWVSTDAITKLRTR
jgi:hypothetical protein